MIMENQDEKWHSLLKWSGSTFAPESTPPYGFITSTLAQLRAEKRQREDLERIGWRALLASLAALSVAAAVTVSVSYRDRVDFEPGVRGLVQMENIQLS